MNVRKNRIEVQKRKEYVRLEFVIRVAKVVLEEVRDIKRYMLCVNVTGTATNCAFIYVQETKKVRHFRLI